MTRLDKVTKEITDALLKDMERNIGVFSGLARRELCKRWKRKVDKIINRHVELVNIEGNYYDAIVDEPIDEHEGPTAFIHRP